MKAATSYEWIVSSDVIAYPEAMASMESRVDAVVANEKQELIWLLEHPPLYTAGTSADHAELKSPLFPIFETGRGGRYTYHGPGQRVIYAITDLRKRGKDLRQHIWRLEQWIIHTIAEFGIKGERREGRVGIWVVTPTGEKKIAAIGVRVRKWVAYHGLALNVEPDLSHFSGIVPCGIAEFGVTSMRQLGIKASMAEIDAAFRKHLSCLIEIHPEIQKLS